MRETSTPAVSGAPGRIRTVDLRHVTAALMPVELQVRELNGCRARCVIAPEIVRAPNTARGFIRLSRHRYQCCVTRMVLPARLERALKVCDTSALAAKLREREMVSAAGFEPAL